jgi:Fe-S cluster biogenesis protein NfuA
MDFLDKIQLHEKITKILEDIRPDLQADGGDIELINITDEIVVEVKLLGACGSCPMSMHTLKDGVEQYLKAEIPEIKEVINIEH